MNVLVTGATGFIGKALLPVLVGRGFKVIAWVRDGARARAVLPGQVDVITALEQWPQNIGLDLVINLAGAPILDRRWSPARKALLYSSRVGLTEQLVSWVKCQQLKPTLMLSGSAIGYYGTHAGDEVLNESAPAGSDFAAGLCSEWERAATEIEEQGTRCIFLRTGLVLGVGGGVLQKMMPAFRLGLGGPIGSGRQFFPWIAQDDYIAALLFLIEQPDVKGPYNLVAPEVVSQRDFAQALGRVLGRPAFLPVPGWVLRMLLGEASGLLLTGQPVSPSKLEQAGFCFRYPCLTGALRALLDLNAK